MNTNLVNIIKRIVYEKGENILSEPKMLNPLFKDYAKNESKEEREAFGRCIEIGAYNELKTATSENERKRRKATIANQLYSKTGKEKKLFLDSLDILEAVVFKTAQNTILSSNINKSPINNVSKTKKN